MKPLLDIQRLSVDFNTKRGVLHALHEVSLTIKAGEAVCLVGESGSGKTIASKAVMRLLGHENGSIVNGRIALSGLDLNSLSQSELRAVRGKKMAMIFQEPMAAFDPVYTIGYQLVETIRRHESMSKSAARKHAASLLGRVGIPEPELCMKQYPGELSGGMLQRAMIAMALSCGPELLIADEPTTALDMTIQAQILRLLKELQKEFGMALLLITHDFGVAARVADRIAVMYAGRIVEQAPAQELFARPRHPYTRGLIESAFMPDRERGEKLPAIPGSIPNLNALPEGCVFHPRCLHATDRCRVSEPPTESFSGSEVACWHASELPGVSPMPESRPPLSESGGAGGTGWGRMHAASEGEDLFRVEGLYKDYPLRSGLPGRSRAHIRAVDGVSFTIRQGETLGLVGESGSGKSTLGRLLLRLEPATAGTLFFQDTNLTGIGASKLRRMRKDMQMIFQDPYGSLDPRWNVGELVGEPLDVHLRLKGADKKERIEEILAAVGLDPSVMNRYPHEFSGGQRQRIGIARAIALNPKFVVADEAVSALDVSVQAQIVNLLQDLQTKMGLTYLFIGHGLHVVRHISDRIAVMHQGRIVELSPSRQLFRRPAHPYTRALIASIPHPDPQVQAEPDRVDSEPLFSTRTLSGCRFRMRCPLATDRCREERPELRRLDGEQYAACHNPLL